MTGTSELDLDRHATADGVLAHVSPDLPNASLPTVYATLDLLEELSIVCAVSAGAGSSPRRQSSL